MKVKPATADAVDLFMRGSIAYAKMEEEGLLIDEKYLKRALYKSALEIKELEQELKDDEVFSIWRKRFGGKTNLGSHDQLEKVVFDELQHKRTGRLTKSGGNKRDESAFEFVDHPFVKKYFRCEKLKKGRNTYLLGIERELSNGRIHPIHNLHIATTYRPSADRPNVRNIPVRNELMAKMIRSCIIAPPGFVILEVDLSGAEVCWSVVYHKDPKMKDYVTNPKSDMHRDIAMQVFKLPRSDDKYWKGDGKTVRYVAKNRMVFPEFYGSWFRDCSVSMWEALDLMKLKAPDGELLKKYLKRNGISKLGDIGGIKGQKTSGRLETKPGTFIDHVREVEDDMWNNRFGVYKQWKWDWWQKYVERGWFRFKTGFVGQGLLDRKQVCNAPIQGSAFHHVLWSLCEMQDWIEAKKLKSRVVNEIYDSLIIYAWVPELEDVLKKAHEIITIKAREKWKCINVPITIEAEVTQPGESWYLKKKREIPI